jgi:Domain of unknown function (DUF4349)
MDPDRDELDLAAELRTLRPAPRPEFTRELDARAAAGFPRADGHPATAIRRLAERLRAAPPRRLLAPAGVFAVAAIVVATAVVATSEDEPTPATHFAERPDNAATQPSGRLEAPRQYEGSSGSAASKDSARTGPPEVQSSSGVEYSAPARQFRNPNTNSGYAAGAGQREIERSAQIVLGTEADRVRADAAKVFDAVHAVDGIVLSSSIRDGASGEAGAEFELLIPSGKLGDALADFSTIAEVRSRRESTQDITAPTIGARERLQDSQARIDGLLAQLSEATTEGERSAVEAELRAERRQAAVLRSRLASLSRRANLSRVSLRIETGAAATGEDDSGAWGVGDGLDDAGRLLEIAAGVTIIGLAALTPLALLALLAWFAYSAWVRASRKRALAQAG